MTGGISEFESQASLQRKFGKSWEVIIEIIRYVRLGAFEYYRANLQIIGKMDPGILSRDELYHEIGELIQEVQADMIIQSRDRISFAIPKAAREIQSSSGVSMVS
jgi:hypothetical protein